MRRAALLIVCLLSGIPLFGQQQKTRLTVFASDIGFTHSDSAGSNVSGGIGAALEYRWTRQWSLEVAVSTERHTGTSDSLPIDVFGEYHRPTNSRWKPFVGAGVRHVQGPESSVAPFRDRTSIEAIAGTYFEITPVISLRLDVKQLLRSDSVPYDRTTKPSVGLAWSF